MNLLEETLELPDQDFLEWFWLKDTYEAPAEVPNILILHGLEGCARSNYVQDLMRQLGSLGWRAVVMQYRNCGEKPNRLAQSYHAMRWQDLDWTIEPSETLPGSTDWSRRFFYWRKYFAELAWSE